MDHTDAAAIAAGLGFSLIKWRQIQLQSAAALDIQSGGDPPLFLVDPILAEPAREVARRSAAAGLSRAARKWQPSFFYGR